MQAVWGRLERAAYHHAAGEEFGPNHDQSITEMSELTTREELKEL